MRSITLDELEAEVQDLMKSIGNRTVNSLWERGLAQSAKRKPSPTDDRYHRAPPRRYLTIGSLG